MKEFSEKMLNHVSVYVTPVLILVIYFCIGNFFSQRTPNYTNNTTVYSSVWCRTKMDKTKLCTFKHICYDSELMTFLFFLDNLSVIKGLTSYKELQTIQLSSVKNHNKFEANISVTNSNEYNVKGIDFTKKGFVFSRFKPDNIMHVIHDDLIPLFLTLEEICLGNMTLCEDNYTLIMHDDYLKGSYFDYYAIFSNHEPLILTQLSKRSKLMCFQELHMGLLRDSIFYQYGFKQLQGPVDNVELNHNDLMRFVSYVSGKINIRPKCQNKTSIVLVSRRQSRRILNEKSLVEMLVNVYGNLNPHEDIKVITLDLIENKTDVFLKELMCASVFVGMHGAEMILALFLRPNSTVIELFPFGIQPNVVSFVKPLGRLKGIHFHYISWVNTLRNHSVFHPDADSLHGGISFLPEETQERIKRVEKVPAVECCNDPTYLYYMYQDTWIDNRFQDFLMGESKRISMSDIKENSITDRWFFPSIVPSVTCSYNAGDGFLNVSWEPPFNINAEALLYDVFILETNSNWKRNVLTSYVTVNFSTVANGVPRKFNVWISAVAKVSNAKGKDVFHECV